MKTQLKVIRNPKPVSFGTGGDRREKKLSLGVTPTTYKWVGALFLFLFLFSPARVIDFDVGIRNQIAHSLWTEGSVFVERGSRMDSGMVWNAQNLGTSFYGIGQSLVLIPFNFIGTGLSYFASSEKTALAIYELPVAFLYVPLMGALWLLLMWAWLRSFGLDTPNAKKTTAIFLLATPAFYYCTQSAQEEALVGVFSLASMVFMHYAFSHSRRFRKFIFLSGMCTGAALLVRLNSLFFFFTLVGLALDAISHKQKKDRFAWTLNLRYFFYGLTPLVALLMLFAYWRYNSPFAFGYEQARAAGLGVSWTTFQPDIAMGFLFGYGKGLFMGAPLLFLSFYGIPRMYKEHPRFTTATGISLLCSTIFIGHIANNPDGSECWSVRYLMHGLPLLVLPSWYGYIRAKKYLLGRVYLIMAFAFGFALALASTWAPNSLEYIQTYEEEKPQSTLMLSAYDGQYFRRIRNIGTGLIGDWSQEKNPDVRIMVSEYSPNVWPAVLSNKFPGFTLLIWTVWFAATLCSITWLIKLWSTPSKKNQSTSATPLLVRLK